MDPINRYLSSLKPFLPTPERDDLLQELSDDIREQVEEKESALGRPLTTSEREAIVGQLDPPLVVAARYRRDHRTLAFGRELIGPALFPLYVKVLKINLTAAAAIIVGITFAMGRPLGAAVTPLFFNLLVQFGIVTVIFSLIEAYKGRLLVSETEAVRTTVWSGHGAARGGATLPERIPAQDRYGRAADSSARVSRLESAAELVALLVFISFLEGIRRSPQWVFGEGDMLFQPGPIWGAIYAPFLLILVANVLQASLNLYRPQWTHLRAASAVLTYVGGLALVGVLLWAGPGVVPLDPAAALTAEHQQRLDFVNRIIVYNVLGSGLVLLVLLLIELRQAVHRWGRGTAPRVSSQPTI